MKHYPISPLKLTLTSPFSRYRLLSGPYVIELYFTAGVRRVVLSTPIAESSLTIEGVRIVIDGGWARAPHFDAQSGMDRLQLVRISRASSDQRRGRAGNTIRLYEQFLSSTVLSAAHGIGTVRLL